MLDSFHLLFGIKVKMKCWNSVWHPYESSNFGKFWEKLPGTSTNKLDFYFADLVLLLMFRGHFFLACDVKTRRKMVSRKRGRFHNTSQVSVWIRRASETCTEDFHVCSQQKKLRRVATTRSNRTELAKNEICGQLIFERHHYICQLNSGRNTLFADF